jgi:hypothetical protein
LVVFLLPPAKTGTFLFLPKLKDPFWLCLRQKAFLCKGVRCSVSKRKVSTSAGRLPPVVHFSSGRIYYILYICLKNC